MKFLKNYLRNILKIRLFHCFLYKKSWNLSTISPNKNQLGAEQKTIELTLNRFPMLFSFQYPFFTYHRTYYNWHQSVGTHSLEMKIVFLVLLNDYEELTMSIFAKKDFSVYISINVKFLRFLAHYLKKEFLK